MPTLTLKFRGSVKGTYRVEKGRPLSIGRRQSHDVVIDNLGVSGDQARIECLERGFLLTDLDSKNGTFVNDERVTTRWLKHGDVITVGKHTLLFEYGDDEMPPLPGGDGIEPTLSVAQDERRRPGAEPVPAAVTPKGKPRPVLAYLNRTEPDVLITKKLVKIGKSDESDVVVSGLGVAAVAATVTQRADGLYLAYVGGLSKPKLNGNTLREPTRLNEFDQIEIGSDRLQLLFRG